MLTRLLLLLSLLLLASPAQADLLFGAVDYPYQGIVTPASALWVGGWEFNAATGQTSPILAVCFYDYATGLYLFPSIIVYEGLNRPDVCAAYPQYPVGNVGWEVFFTTPPPPGRYRMWVSWAEFDFAQLDQPVEVTVL